MAKLASTSERLQPLVGSALLGLGAALALGTAVRAAAPRDTFRGKVVVITGGSRGLGLAMARCFAHEGAHLALIARTADELERAAAELVSDFGVQVLTVICDVRDQHAVDRAVGGIVQRFGAIDVLVNNAGIIQVMPFEHAQLEDFRASLETHFWAPLYMTRACLAHLTRAGGRVINISSVGGRLAIPHLLPYAAGKFALVGLSEGLNAELRGRGVHVTTVTPHLMRTGSHRNVLARGQHAKEATWFALGASTPLTAMSADRAARQIVEAARARRAQVTPGWQARVAILGKALAPELVAAITALASAALLPAPADDATVNTARHSRDLDLGTVAEVFPTDAARDLNQPIARDEAARN